MEQKQTATQIRYMAESTALAYNRLARYPEAQAEEIARHYCAHANLALGLRKLCEMRRQSDPSQRAELDEVIEYCVKQIKTNHRMDLGIALEWKHSGQGFLKD